MELMCTIKQPLSMKDVSISGLKNLYGMFLSTLIEDVNKCHLNNSKQNVAPQLFGQHILSGVPSLLADEVFAALEEVWQEKYSQIKDDEEIVTSVLSESMRSVLSNLNVKTLSLNEKKHTFVTPMLECLTSMPQLQHVCLQNLHDSIDAHMIRSLVSDGLEYLPNLKVFVFDQCTEKIFGQLSKNCPMLQHIKLSISGDTVSPKIILDLAECKQLKCISLDCCILPVEAVASLMISHTSLEEIDVFQMDEVLDVIEKKQTRCFLKSITSLITSKHLRTVNELCPQIQKLVVKVNECADLCVENKLQYLEDLTLSCLDFSDCNVLPFFLMMGNLKCLSLLCAANMTGDSFRIVAENCPRLETLYLSHLGHIWCEQLVELSTLTNLILYSGGEFEFLLHIRCPSLRQIIVNCFSPIDSDVIVTFLNLNSKSHFTKLSSKDVSNRFLTTYVFQCFSENVCS